MKNRKKPVILEKITVEDYAAEGKSLARVNGKVIFVENAVPGDVADIRLHKSKKDWAEGEAINFISYSKDRVTPFCSHFGVCGGCQWQMLPYEKQLAYKQKQVADNLQRISKQSLPQIRPIIGCETTTGYRNKMEYTFCNKKYVPAEEFRKMREDGMPGTEDAEGYGGFHAKGVFDKVVEIDICHLQKEPTNKIRKYIAGWALQNNMQFYDARVHTGWLRNVQVRMTEAGGLMVNIILGYEHETARKALLDGVMQHFTGITTLLYTINTKWNDSIFDIEPQVYHGDGYILEKLEDFVFKISPKSFFQTNTRQAEKLYQVAREYAELTGTQTLYDLYCGTGSIGIFASRQAGRIVGVEVVQDAIADARQNALLNNLNNAVFCAGDVIEVCNDAFFAANGKPDVVITDPPRAGMHEKLVTKLLHMAAPLMVYVSCNPATQARDLYLLGEKYSVEKIQPVDMFPHTHHIENVVQLKLRD